jgi:nitrogen PTS system EIIA component
VEDSAKLARIAEKYRAEKIAEGSWRSKTAAEHEAVHELPIQIVGNVETSTITHKTAREFKDALLKLPANMTKGRYAEKTVKQNIAMNPPEADRLAPKTVNDEDLMCVVGWSPEGIDYGAKDGKVVKLVVMYLVPANQRNHYLREISMLAKAVETYPDIEKLDEAKELNDVRHYLLDLITTSKETVGPDIRARMIRLQAKPKIEPLPLADLSNLIVEPVTLVSIAGIRHIALTQNADLTEWLDSSAGLIEKLEQEGVYQYEGWRLLRRSTMAYQGGKTVYDCLAIRIAAN